jgi:hypothetical protein
MTAVAVDRAREITDAAATPPEWTGTPATREVRHEYTRTLPALLSQLGVSLLVSTYQAGKVVAVGAHQGELTLSYHNFERAMGLAVKPDAIAGVMVFPGGNSSASEPGRPDPGGPVAPQGRRQAPGPLRYGR